jgi:hypothetical protein
MDEFVGYEVLGVTVKSSACGKITAVSSNSPVVLSGKAVIVK